MKVTFTLTLEDLWRYNMYHRRHKAKIRQPLLIVIAGLASLLGLAFAAMFFYSWLYVHDPFWAAIPAIAAIVFIVPRFFPTKRRLASVTAKTPGSLGEHMIVISPEWFFEKTVVSETKRVWSAFESFDEDANYMYFFISKTHAYVIPKRAFSSLAESQAFLDKARRYRDAALTGQPALEETNAQDTGVWPPPPQSVKQS